MSDIHDQIRKAMDLHPASAGREIDWWGVAQLMIAVGAEDMLRKFDEQENGDEHP